MRDCCCFPCPNFMAIVTLEFVCSVRERIKTSLTLAREQKKKFTSSRWAVFGPSRAREFFSAAP